MSPRGPASWDTGLYGPGVQGLGVPPLILSRGAHKGWSERNSLQPPEQEPTRTTDWEDGLGLALSPPHHTHTGAGTSGYLSYRFQTGNKYLI